MSEAMPQRHGYLRSDIDWPAVFLPIAGVVIANRR